MDALVENGALWQQAAEGTSCKLALPRLQTPKSLWPTASAPKISVCPTMGPGSFYIPSTDGWQATPWHLVKSLSLNRILFIWQASRFSPSHPCWIVIGCFSSLVKPSLLKRPQESARKFPGGKVQCSESPAACTSWFIISSWEVHNF